MKLSWKSKIKTPFSLSIFSKGNSVSPLMITSDYMLFGCNTCVLQVYILYTLYCL